MKISIVTPVLNGAKTIARTLESIAKQHGDYEHIVIDGGSKDETRDIVNKFVGRYNLKYLYKPDKSLYEGVLNGLKEAQGEILCYLNADDVYFPWTASTVADVFHRHPQVDWITGTPSWFDETSGQQRVARYAPVYLRKNIRSGKHNAAQYGYLQQESMFWRRRLFEIDLKGVESILLKYRLAGDFHLWRHFSLYSELYTVPANLGMFTISPNQLSAKLKDRYVEECGTNVKLWYPRRFYQIRNRINALVFSGRILTPRFANE